MRYFSTQNQSPLSNFREAAIRGQAPDKGLYFPERVPVLDSHFIRHLEQYSEAEIALRVIEPYVGAEIPKPELEQIVRETIQFQFPLVKVEEGMYSLELFHGPTLAFKDVGARFMSRCLGYFMKGAEKKVTVLVATSGDTGGAVASGFYGVEGVEVVILYPSKKVSSVQELQLTTLGKNIRALEIEGSFDDCQQMVKQAFADPDLHRDLFLTSANSINIARWLPQQFYYFFACRQWPEKDHPPVFSVPSGNFGNICAGLLAYKSGLPAAHFIAACNSNQVVTQYLQTGQYHPKPSVPTLSNAMDVGNPSNFVRILELFHHQFDSLKQVLSSESFSDTQTRALIKDVYEKKGYLMDPHGAVGYGALQNYLERHPGAKGIFLETAHPVKFYDAVQAVTHDEIPMPSSIKDLLPRKKESLLMKADFRELKEYLTRAL